MKKLNNLSKIYDQYETFVIDLWGVIHNGVKLNPNAIEVVENLYKFEKKIIFLSNAPRPSKNVIKFLIKLKMNQKFLKNVVTSGEAALVSIRNQKFGKKFFHLGPERDSDLFFGLEEFKSNIDDCDYILCTGLFDEKPSDLTFYRHLLKNHTSKILVCTNPDLVVHRGEILEYCAGTIASIFEKIGGKVTYYGKPHDEIYNMILSKNEKAIIIGDNLNTDIKGANNLNLDSIFITDGIHIKEFSNENEIQKLMNNYNVNSKYFQNNLKW